HMLPRSEFAASFWRVYGALQAATNDQPPFACPPSSTSSSSAGPASMSSSSSASSPPTGSSALSSSAAAGGRVVVGMPSFFTFMTLLALDAFLARPPELRPHVVVLEVGIGGRLDATNGVVTHGSLAAAGITSLGMDHVELLGDTLPKIAREKAGIMKAGRPVLVSPQQPDAMQALQEVSARVGAPLAVPPPLQHYRLSLSSCRCAAVDVAHAGGRGNNGSGGGGGGDATHAEGDSMLVLGLGGE
ncbi:hypothetical protein Agub_g14011, partial [Astrephomene gubernaculifera]